MWKQVSIIFLLAVCIASCKPPVFTPKPTGYFLIDTPARHEYRQFARPGFPYTFEYPVYAEIEQDTAFQGEHANNPYWININFPTLGAAVNITYKEITDKEPLDMLIQKAYDLSFFHHEKADYIDPIYFTNPNHVTGVVYSIGGDAASKYQFTATDSVKHFMRGALYFDVTPNSDSLKPAYDFLQKDMEHMIYTLRFGSAKP